MIYKDKYYCALNDGHVCTDGNWYPNDICYKDYYTDEWIATEQDSVIYLDDVGEYADSNSDKFEAYQCAYCLKWFVDNYNIVITQDTQEIYCTDCADIRLYECEDCNRYFADSDNITSDADGKWLCNDCLGEYFVCSDCECFVSEDDARWIDDNNNIVRYELDKDWSDEYNEGIRYY